MLKVESMIRRFSVRCFISGSVGAVESTRARGLVGRQNSNHSSLDLTCSIVAGGRVGFSWTPVCVTMKIYCCTAKGVVCL